MTESIKQEEADLFRHAFLPDLFHYAECPLCGFVQIARVSAHGTCAGCLVPLTSWRPWFPDEIYEYAVILEDYHSRPPTKLRKKYFEASRDSNLFEYWCSETPPVFAPTSDWKPVSILLFRSIFETAMGYFLWRTARAQLLPSEYAEPYATFLVEEYRSISERIDKLYRLITNNKWSADLSRFGFADLDLLLRRTATTRNAFLHRDPHAGHEEGELAVQARNSVPRVLELFARLANEYYHPRAKTLFRLRVGEEDPSASGAQPAPPADD